MRPRRKELSLNCIKCSDLGAALEHPLFPNQQELFVLDLSLGAYRGLQIARDLAVQLDIDLKTNLIGVDSHTNDPSELIAAWVDAEGRGDQLVAHTAAFAQALADAILRRMSATLLITGHCVDNISEEDGSFIWFILNELIDTKVQCFCVCGEPEKISNKLAWLNINVLDSVVCGNASADQLALFGDPMIWVPGLIPAKLLMAFAELGYGSSVVCLPLCGDMYLISPHCRAEIRNIQPKISNDVLNLIRDFPEVYASWIALGIVDPDESDFSVVAATAWSISGQGGVSLAEKILVKLTDCALRCRSRLYGVLLRDLQSLRISAQLYAQASIQEADENLLNQDERRDYFYTLGWARVLGGDPVGSKEAFAKVPCPNLVDVSGPIDLYLCNIYALTLFRNKEYDQALSLEKGIGRKLRLAGDGNWHLKYINHFNLSRLYRVGGNIDLERDELNGVMNTTLGLKTDVDQIYFNLTWASLELRAGNYFDALRYTWRACVHWLSCQTPEALGWRTSLFLFSKSVRLQPGESIRVTQVLYELLMQRAADANIEIENTHSIAPKFANICRVSENSIQSSKIVKSGNLGILLGTQEVVDSPFGSEHDYLSKAVTAIFFSQSSNNIPEFSSWLVDDEFGHEIPFSSEGVRRLSLRWQVESLYPLKDRVLNTDTSNFYILRNPGVERIELLDNGDVFCKFKRYLGLQKVPHSLVPLMKRLVDSDRISLDEALKIIYDEEMDVPSNICHLLRRVELGRFAVLRWFYF